MSNHKKRRNRSRKNDRRNQLDHGHRSKQFEKAIDWIKHKLPWYLAYGLFRWLIDN